jgi:hypothetical protein
MTRSRPPRRAHELRLGELVRLVETVPPLERGDVVQIVGFRGASLVRVMPVGGIPVVAHHELVASTGLAGEGKPKGPRRRRRRQPRPASSPAPAS